MPSLAYAVFGRGTVVDQAEQLPGDERCETQERDREESPRPLSPDHQRQRGQDQQQRIQPGDHDRGGDQEEHEQGWLVFLVTEVDPGKQRQQQME